MRNFASKHESMDKLIGRDKEHAELERCLNSDRSELVIVYGRRRIGKTFLIEEFFDRELISYMSVLMERPPADS